MENVLRSKREREREKRERGSFTTKFSAPSPIKTKLQKLINGYLATSMIFNNGFKIALLLTSSFKKLIT